MLCYWYSCTKAQTSLRNETKFCEMSVCMNEFSNEMEETLAGGVFFSRMVGWEMCVQPDLPDFLLSRVKFGLGKAACLQFQGGC